MEYGLFALGAAGSLLTTVHFASAAIAAWRCHPASSPPPELPRGALPPVTILRPVCGIDNYAEETLASAFLLDYPHYEIVFCVADAGDPVVPLVTRLMEKYSHVPSRLLFGERFINANPKLNNIAKGYDAAAHEWIVIADSNVLMPPDYLQRLLTCWRADTGLVCSPPVGCAPGSFAAEIECAFLNGFQARCQLTSDAIGFGFAQGKSMLWRRSDLDRAGGIAALGCDLAEDAASTKVVRGLGLKVRLTTAPFAQPLGKRSFQQIWKRQARWAQLRRASFPLFYAGEIITGPWLPLLAVAAAADALDVAIAPAVLGFAMLWYGAEMLMTSLAGWHLSWALLPASVARDLLLPALWVSGWRASGFVWRGNAMSVREPATAD
jgi:ceramide glucosyltransferase